LCAPFVGSSTVRSARSCSANITRKDILKRYGVDKAGFIFRLPGALLPPPGR
jgi:hypothetical protein